MSLWVEVAFGHHEFEPISGVMEKDIEAYITLIGDDFFLL